jgi:hypothetical protein
METEHVQYLVEELDGVRMIRVIFPQVLVPSSLPEAFARYLALWEHDVPTTVLIDMERLVHWPEDARRALRVLLGRIAIMPNFVASVWTTGRNAAIAVEMRTLLVEAGGDRTLFEREADAVDYLRGRIAARRAGPG